MSSSFSAPLIHVVEDDNSVRDALCAVFKSEGFATECWSSGEEFLNSAQVEPEDIVVLDIQLPGQSGPLIATTLRQHVPDIKVIVISGLKASLYDQAIHNIAPFASFRKPLRHDDLIASVRAAITVNAGAA